MTVVVTSVASALHPEKDIKMKVEPQPKMFFVESVEKDKSQIFDPDKIFSSRSRQQQDILQNVFF